MAKPWIVPLLFTLVFSILLIGQYSSKTGALFLNQGNRLTALIFIAVGYCCLLSRGLAWIVLLKYVRLSVAYPIQALSFILIAMLGAMAFNEALSASKIFGIILILLGVTSIAIKK